MKIYLLTCLEYESNSYWDSLDSYRAYQNLDNLIKDLKQYVMEWVDFPTDQFKEDLYKAIETLSQNPTDMDALEEIHSYGIHIQTYDLQD